MKRFFTDAAVAPADGGFTLLLDGRAVKTPARAALVFPTQALAEAVAAEWRAQGDTIDPRSMPLTGLANAAIDRVSPSAASVAASLARFGESDLLCYRAASPAKLVARQAAAWDPFLAWARRCWDVELVVVTGVTHRPQPAEAVARLGRAVAARTAWALAGLTPLATVSGSIVIALAVAERAMPFDAAWAAASLDEQWQLDEWGADRDAEMALAARRRDFAAGARLIELLG